MSTGRDGAPGGPGALLDHVRRGRARTRAELADVTGLSRSTITSRLDALQRNGFLVPDDSGPSTGGRPPGSFRVDETRGILAAVDIGGSHVRVALSDLSCTVLAETRRSLAVGLGPDVVLEAAAGDLAELITRSGSRAEDLRAVGIGVPGPVDATSGHVVSPPIMTGWDGTHVPGRFTSHLARLVPVGELGGLTVVDNDANCMAIAEHRRIWPDRDDLLFVKASTGVGSGMVLGGRLHRGADGAAGDIGHLPAPAGPRTAATSTRALRGSADAEPLCRCGALGCIEAFAGGWALVDVLRERGFDVSTTGDVVDLARNGDPAVSRLVREAGRVLGHAVADVVGIVNPSTVVLGGVLAGAGEQILAGVREIVLRRSSVLATGRLQVVPSRLGALAAAIGAAELAADAWFAPTRVDLRCG